MLASLKVHECVPCARGPSGEAGHDALRYVMLAPETDRTYYRCSECGERWTRSAGMMSRFVWSRYKAQDGRKGPNAANIRVL
jgi:hypothetical protein